VLVVLALSILPAPAVAQSGGPGQPLIHVVQRGETLFSIARRYQTSVDAITHANGIADPMRIYIGQQLLVPGVPALPGTWVTHAVQPGETLEAVAVQYGLPWRTVALANRLLNPHLLTAGQVLQVPVGDGVFLGGALHTVQPGETATGLAFRYGITLWELREVNRTTDTVLLLYPGRWLLIPGLRPSWMPAPFAEVNLDPLPVQQGRTLRIRVRMDEPAQLRGRLFDRPVAFVEENGVYYALVGVHAFAEPGLYELTLTAPGEGGAEVAVSVGVIVEQGAYGYERIVVPASQSELLAPDLVATEQARLEELRTLFTPQRRWRGPFLQPVDAAVSSYFGTRRSYSGGPYNSYHAGVDFNAGKGAAVRAPADGIVVLAEPLAVRGNALMLDHGWGVLSGYWHLSGFEVAVGQEVRAGDIIARVGNTGLSTGAHLHWELWVGGVSVDALKWLAPAYPWDDMEPTPAP